MQENRAVSEGGIGGQELNLFLHLLLVMVVKKSFFYNFETTRNNLICLYAETDTEYKFYE